MPEPNVDEVVRRLYGEPRSDFIAARRREAAAAKDAGDAALAKQVAGFGKPTVGADLLNHWVRGADELLTEIGALGDALRSAQAHSEAAELRRLGEERRVLVRRCVADAKASARASDTTPTAASLRDVEQTVRAALADEAALAALRSGTLLRPLSPDGFGTVDLSGATALAIDPDEDDLGRKSTRRPTKATPRDDRAMRDAERHLKEAKADLADAAGRVARARDDVESSEHSLVEARRELETLRDQLAEAEDAERRVSDQHGEHEFGLKSAERDRGDAEAAVEKARRRLDHLRNR